MCRLELFVNSSNLLSFLKFKLTREQLEMYTREKVFDGS